MTEPCNYGKNVAYDSSGGRLRQLKKLAALMKAMGSSKEPVWRGEPPPADFPDMFEEFTKTMRKYESNASTNIPLFARTYISLGWYKLSHLHAISASQPH